MEPLQSSPSDPQPDWARLLPREAFQEIILILRGALPPPLSDEPADWVRRDRAAMAAVAALLPENAAEGRLAAQFVAADAWAMDCLRLAGERRREPDIARQCRAQAMSLMREGKSTLRLLLRMQAARRAIADDEAAASHAAWAEHSALGMMEEALGPVAPIAHDDWPPSFPGEADRMEIAPRNIQKYGPYANFDINPKDACRETVARPRSPSIRVAS